MTALKLDLTAAQLEELFEKANGRGKKATVDRKALMSLLVDYNRMRDTFGRGELSTPEGGA